MIKVVVKNIVKGKQEIFYGSEEECAHKLRLMFPEAKWAPSLSKTVQEINATGEAEVEAEPYYPSPESNILPKGYLTHEEEEPDRGR